MEDLIRKIDGVVATTVGYTGGHLENPTYKHVRTGSTGHFEAIEIEFNPGIVSYETILKHFFKLHDPTQADGQGNDHGPQYMSAIFFHDASQKEVAQNLMTKIAPYFEHDLATKLIEASEFYPAEEYHQDYLEKNPNGYTCHYYRSVDFW